jgi:hypothetical protein
MEPKYAKKRSHLFSIDVLIEDGTNGEALEKLLHVLNNPLIRDYRVVKGIELGAVIHAAVEAHSKKASKAEEPASSGATAPSAKPAQAEKKKDDHLTYLAELITNYQKQGTLIRLSIIKGKGVKLSLPCRVLNFDSNTENLSVYHVDEKKVYLFKLNEIDDITTN